jgi:putative transposase
LPNKLGFNPKIKLKSKKCIDTALQPLSDHVTIKINGSLKSEDIFRTVISMSVNRNSVHSVTARYQNVADETSLRYHLKKLNMGELIKSNEKILLQEVVKTLKTDKSYEFAVDYTNDPYYVGVTQLALHLSFLLPIPHYKLI